MRLRHRELHPVRRTVRPAAVAALVASAAVLGSTVPTGSATAATSHRSVPVEVRVGVATAPAHPVTTDAQWPTGALADAGIALTPLDRILVFRDGRTITAPRNRAVHPGDTIKVVRIARHVRVSRTAIKPRTVVTKTTRIKPGARKVVAHGRAGVRQRKVVSWTRNGHRIATEVHRHVVRAAAPRRVLVGVRARTVPGAAHLNWRALAHCESGGNPHAVNPAGYYGLYQFDVGTWRSVGGSGLPTSASAGEQTYRAKLLYKQRGRSPWPTCGRLL